MAFCRLVFPLLVISVIQCYASTEVPVFVWGDIAKPALKSYPLSTTTTEEFSRTLNIELASDPFTVIFIEETLSVEDFSRKDAEGATSFPFLKSSIKDAIYIPSVENPVHVLNKLADPEKADHVKLTENGLSAEIEPENGKFLFINLKDAEEGESRSDLLRRHNDFMEDMFAKLKEQYERVVGIYTAHYPSWTVTNSHSRVRRQAQNNAVNNDITIEGLRLYMSALWLQDGQQETNLLAGGILGNSTTLNETAQEMNATLVYNNNRVTLNFNGASGYWFLSHLYLSQDNPAVTARLEPETEIYALSGWSYRCLHNVTYSTINDTTRSFRITFQDLKVQPYFNSTNTDFTFGDSFNCVGFFSIAIWSGLFIVFILLFITFYGIMMMMDIRTMDRFDDPKGKTITINAAE